MIFGDRERALVEKLASKKAEMNSHVATPPPREPRSLCLNWRFQVQTRPELLPNQEEFRRRGRSRLLYVKFAYIRRF